MSVVCLLSTPDCFRSSRRGWPSGKLRLVHSSVLSIIVGYSGVCVWGGGGGGAVGDGRESDILVVYYNNL